MYPELLALSPTTRNVSNYQPPCIQVVKHFGYITLVSRKTMQLYMFILVHCFELIAFIQNALL